MPIEARRYLDEAAAAQKLNISRRTLQRWRTTGEGPSFIRAGARRVLYEDGGVDAWAAGRTFNHRADELSQRAA